MTVDYLVNNPKDAQPFIFLTMERTPSSTEKNSISSASANASAKESNDAINTDFSGQQFIDPGEIVPLIASTSDATGAQYDFASGGIVSGDLIASMKEAIANKPVFGGLTLRAGQGITYRDWLIGQAINEQALTFEQRPEEIETLSKNAIAIAYAVIARLATVAEAEARKTEAGQ